MHSHSMQLHTIALEQVADALAQPFKDNSFDLIWSMESGEHMPNKPQFVQELARVCAPGGKVLIVTWCHRDLKEVRNFMHSLQLFLTHSHVFSSLDSDWFGVFVR